MEIREQLLTVTEVRNLEHVGFSSEEIASLFRLKELYQRGAYQEATPEFKRLAFVRWLYEQVMSQLQLSLLGTPVVKHGERTLTFPTRKALALLVYLAVEGGMHPRKTLSESFWPELDAEHGRAALRATLLELRKLLERSHGPGEQTHLLVERDTLGFDQGSPLIL